jgi:DNA-binding NarL/FixJ family response regulator
LKKRILIADDGQEVREVVRAIVEARTEYEICGEACNGVEAVEKALQLKPDLVLLDIAMPMLNGVEVASVLAGSMPQLAVVLYTMYSESLGASLANVVGARAVISKTEGMGKLLECIQGVLGSAPATPNPAPSTLNSETTPATPSINLFSKPPQV